jgi:hypothetical protein
LTGPSEGGVTAVAMICRLWRGWTTTGNADAYERIVRGEVIPGFDRRSTHYEVLDHREQPL